MKYFYKYILTLLVNLLLKCYKRQSQIKSIIQNFVFIFYTLHKDRHKIDINIKIDISFIFFKYEDCIQMYIVYRGNLNVLDKTGES